MAKSAHKSKPKLTPKSDPSLLFYGSAVYDFLSPFKKAQNQWAARYMVVIFAIIIRSAIGLGSYSGFNTPPMYGDFEAQRHWLEITQHLPISKWYWYDLQYWGLDYPPLTAYHSYLLGKLGSLIDSSWFALDTSRGFESIELKSYMRFTVLLSEVIIFIPAVLRFSRWSGRSINQSPIDQTIVASAILFQPALILIDHGHFQYNSVMLGLTLLSIVHLLYENYALASIFFVLSLGFKQMALYYSPIIFFYLLGRCINLSSSPNISLSNRVNLPRLIVIAVSTFSTFTFLFGPLYVFGSMDNLKQSVIRIFPFNRGIFEDKVANFWCFANIFIKFRSIFTQVQLQRLSLLLTLLGFTPSSLLILFRPRKKLLVWALAACSFSFYLFSFQVHEKTILVPLLPITLLYSTTNTDEIAMVSWINNIASFSLWPLLKRDGLLLQYISMVTLSNWLLGNLSFLTPRFLPWFLTPGPSISSIRVKTKKRHGLPSNWFWGFIILSSYLGGTIIHLCEFFLEPPAKYPELWVLANVSLSFGCFGLFWLWIHWKMFKLKDVTV
jgi:alpha-1,3-glucosyltransferase